MDMILFYFILYLIMVNGAAFILYGLDKRRARLHRWRIRESVLLGIAVLGGSAGAILGMSVFHHKTRKPRFRSGLWIILVIQLILGLYLGQTIFS